MSVAIKGFDKPSDCDYCTLQDYGYCNVLLSYINVEHGIDTRCPLTEISGYTLPNGHKVVIGKTENSSEIPNNSTISILEQVEDEPQTDYKKWDAPPKVKLPTGEITTCVSVLAAAFEEASAFEDKLQMERSE